MRESIHKIYTKESHMHFLEILELLRQWQEDSKQGVELATRCGLCGYVNINTKKQRTNQTNQTKGIIK